MARKERDDALGKKGSFPRAMVFVKRIFQNVLHVWCHVTDTGKIIFSKYHDFLSYPDFIYTFIFLHETYLNKSPRIFCNKPKVKSQILFCMNYCYKIWHFVTLIFFWSLLDWFHCLQSTKHHVMKICFCKLSFIETVLCAKRLC